MVRILWNRIMINKGDTGEISIPKMFPCSPLDMAVLTVYDKMYKTKIIEKVIYTDKEFLSFLFYSEDTRNLEPRTYYWDITIYRNPLIDEDGFPINGDSVDSYYGSRKQLPKFIVKGGI